MLERLAIIAWISVLSACAASDERPGATPDEEIITEGVRNETRSVPTPEVVLIEPIAFDSLAGESITVPPGAYGVKCEEGTDAIVLAGVDREYVLSADVGQGGDPIDYMESFLISADEGLSRHLVVLMPDGRSLAAEGSEGMVQPRGRRRLGVSSSRIRNFRRSSRRATLRVSEPGSSTYWELGGKGNVRWQSSGTGTSRLTVDLYQGSRLVVRLARAVANSGRHTCTVPSDLIPGSYAIRVSTTDGRARAIGKSFSIVVPAAPVAPEAGNELKAELKVREVRVGKPLNIEDLYELVESHKITVRTDGRDLTPEGQRMIADLLATLEPGHRTLVELRVDGDGSVDPDQFRRCSALAARRLRMGRTRLPVVATPPRLGDRAESKDAIQLELRVMKFRFGEPARPAHGGNHTSGKAER